MAGGASASHAGGNVDQPTGGINRVSGLGTEILQITGFYLGSAGRRRYPDDSGDDNKGG